jgi:hypothetical protein
MQGLRQAQISPLRRRERCERVAREFEERTRLKRATAKYIMALWNAALAELMFALARSNLSQSASTNAPGHDADFDQ